MYFFAIWSTQLLVSIQEVLDSAHSLPNMYAYDLKHLSDCACDTHIGSMTLTGVLNVLSGTPTCSQNSDNCCHSTHVAIIRDSHYFCTRLHRCQSLQRLAGMSF
jgi:hypothetical protein